MDHVATYQSNSLNSWIAAVSGGLGGSIKFFTMQVNPVPVTDAHFWLNTIPAVITAAMCAVAGLIAKEIFFYFKKRYLKRKK